MKATVYCMLLVYALSTCISTAFAQEVSRGLRLAGSDESTDRIIVEWRSGVLSETAKDAVRAAASRSIGAQSALQLHTLRRMDSRMEVMRSDALLNDETLQQTLTALRADPDVEYAVPDRRRQAHTLPDDPLFAGQWFLQEVEASATHATTAWNTTLGSPAVVVAVLDTGVRFEHPDLQGKLLAGYDFISADSPGIFLTANDGHGRSPDASDPGDWINATDKQNPLFSKCPIADSSWHGTRVSGIIAAATDNAVGVAGIGWNTRILPVRVLGKCGGYDSDIIDGMRWAVGIHVDGVPDNANPAQIVNLSLGGKGACSAAYAEVVGELIDRGVLIVASAGNEGGPVEEPANCTGVLGVAGLRQAGTKVGYSNLGQEIGISAPAGNCVNASGACLFSLDTTTNQGITVPTTSGYTDQVTTNIGTSFSAPIVAGVAALMLAVNPALMASQLTTRLQSGATPFPTRSTDTGVTAQCQPEPQGSSAVQNVECVCTTQTCGVGMVNAASAVTEAMRPIAVIRAPAEVPAGRTAALSGSSSTAAQGHTLVGYRWTTNGRSAIVSTSETAVVAVPPGQTVTAELTVTDDVGRTDSTSLMLTAAMPTAAPAAIPVNQPGGGGGLSTRFLVGLMLLGVSCRFFRRWNHES